MDFGKEKCAPLVMEKRKVVKSVSIESLEGKVIKSLHEDESYKYHWTENHIFFFQTS